jgi:hypothetical protein
MTEGQQYAACCLLFAGFIILVLADDRITALLSLGMAGAVLLVRTVPRR